MKKTISLMFVFLLLVSPMVSAQTVEQEAGVTPDNPLWGLEIVMEKIMTMLMTNQQDKINYGLQIADERLAEMEVMIKENKEDFVYQIEIERNRIVNQIATQEMTELTEQHKIQIRQRLEKHVEAAEQVREQTKEQTQEYIKTSVDQGKEILEKMQLKLGNQ